MSEQMKPCPFCGGEAVAESYAIEAAVRCLSCRAKIVRPHGAHTDNGYPDAIAAWNRRAPITEGMESRAVELATILRRHYYGRSWTTEMLEAANLLEDLSTKAPPHD